MQRYFQLFITNILIFSSTAFAGRADRAFDALEEYNYFKAKHLFEKSIKRNTITAAYGLATIYSRNDNPFYQLDSAKKYISLSVNQIDTLDEKQLYRLEKRKITYQDIYQLEQSVNAKKFQWALDQNTIRDYNFYITNYLEAIQYDAVISLRNELAFEQAKKIGTPEAYFMFLERYPEAAQKLEAKANYELSLFESITASDSLGSYITFLNQYPNSPFANKAQNIIYEKITTNGSLESYIDFVNRFGENKNSNKAWRNIYKLYTKDFSAEKIAEFRLDFPKYPFMDELMVDFELAGKQFYPVIKDNKYGYIDEHGNEMLGFNYGWAGNFKEGGAIVEQNDFLGIINKQGSFLIPAIYDELESFSNGIAIVGLSGKYGLINKLNQLITPLIYDEIEAFADGLALVELNGKSGFINKSGEIIIPIQFSSAGSFSNGFAYAEMNNKKGIINSKGEVVIDFEHDWVENFNENGVARARKSNKFGVYANNGSLIVDFAYANIGEFSNGYALIADSLHYTFITTEGKPLTDFIFEFKLEALSFSKFDQNGFAPIITKGKVGIIDTSGEKVVPAIFEAIGKYKATSLTAIKKKGDWGYMNAETRLTIPYKFQFAGEFINEQAIVQTEVGFGLISSEGKLILKDDYTSINRLEGVGYLLEKSEEVQLVDWSLSPILDKNYRSIESVNDEMLQLKTINSVEIYNLSLKQIVWK